MVACEPGLTGSGCTRMPRIFTRAGAPGFQPSRLFSASAVWVRLAESWASLTAPQPATAPPVAPAATALGLPPLAAAPMAAPESAPTPAPASCSGPSVVMLQLEMTSEQPASNALAMIDVLLMTMSPLRFGVRERRSIGPPGGLWNQDPVGGRARAVHRLAPGRPRLASGLLPGAFRGVPRSVSGRRSRRSRRAANAGVGGGPRLLRGDQHVGVDGLLKTETREELSRALRLPVALQPPEDDAVARHLDGDLRELVAPECPTDAALERFGECRRRGRRRCRLGRRRCRCSGGREGH